MRDAGAPAYLSRIPISDRLGVYRIHQEVYEACGRENRPLWRKCPGYVLALARVPAAGFQHRPFQPSPVSGREVRFDLLAEVSVAKKTESGARSRRHDPILEARFADPRRPYSEIARDIGTPWLGRQGTRHGFEVLNLTACEYQVIEFVRMHQQVRVGAVRFTGWLRVTDAERFRQAMLVGIGHGKAWGCGMLLCFGG